MPSGAKDSAAQPIREVRAARKELIFLILGFAALVFVGAATVWLVNRSADYNAQVQRTLETRSDVAAVLGIVKDAETGQRGYLLTNDQRYLFPYDNAFSQIDGQLAHLDGLLPRAGPQRDDFAAMKAAVWVKLAELKETVELQKAGRQTEARSVVESDRGRQAMRDVRRLADAMTARENASFTEGQATAALNATTLLIVVVIGLLVASLLAFLAQIVVRRQTRVLQAAQAQLEDANTGLEAAVAERTADLTRANEEIQRFAYIVSHDLRAPLVNVMGFTSELDAARKTLKDQIDAIAERDPETVTQDARLAVDEDLPEAIGFIRTSTAKMDRLINAILKLSREGRRVVTPESVSVKDLAETIVRTVHQQALAADAEILVEPNTPPLVTDRLAIEQVFQNLIENAVKYLDRSRPGRVVIRGRRMGPFVEYAIEDNGRGIDAKDQERVFELFRRAGAQDQPGDGLGLAFVRASVRRLGGTISLTSEAGRGSTFTLTFPAVYRPQAESAAS